MTTLVTAVNTEFTPAAGIFEIRVSTGQVQLGKKITGDTVFGSVGIFGAGSALVDNPSSGAVYMFLPYAGFKGTVFAGQA